MEMDDLTWTAFQRLLKIARSNTHQARRVADFLLAWWNADALGKFDLASVFAVDRRIATDMAVVFSWMARQDAPIYPTEYRAEIEAIIAEWRPDVWAASRQSA